MSTTDLATTTAPLVNVETGEALDRTPENAVTVIAAARDMKSRIQEVIGDATGVLVEESARVGTKTLHLDGHKAALTGGETVEYDASALLELLADAGCPQDRIDAAVTAQVTYKVDRSVLRQLAAANPDYKAAIELASTTVVKPWGVKIT